MIGIISTLVVVLVVMGFYANTILNRMRAAPIQEDKQQVLDNANSDEDYLASKPSIAPALTKSPEKTNTLYNIMLYGIDARNATSFEGGLSDTMILMQMDTQKQTVKLISFMRDSWVSIPGYSQNRLNTCYRFGGHALAQEVFSSHFGIDVDHYAVVNFWSFAELVDILGGVEIDVQKNELYPMEVNLNEVGKRNETPKQAGLQHLNGAQTVAYARIRSAKSDEYGGGDFGRTGRQREVISAILDEAKRSSLAEILGMLDVGVDHVRTNMSNTELIAAAKAFMALSDVEMQELRIPVDGAYQDASKNGASVLDLDFEKNADAIREFLNN